MVNELEFYKKASELRDNLSKKRNTYYLNFLSELVSFYFLNGNQFPDKFYLPNFDYKRISIIKEMLLYLGFFNDRRPVEEYEFVKEYILLSHNFVNEFESYTLIIRPKKQ